jgi:CHASE3 domain sensor protein
VPVTSTTFARATIALLLVGLLTLLGIVAASLWLADRTETYADSILDLQQIRLALEAAAGL